MSDIGIGLDQVWANGENPQQIRRALQALSAILNESVQPKDDDLTAISDLTGTGLAARTSNGPEAWAVRTLTAPAAGITVANGDGVSGNPTLALANDLSAYEGLSTTGLVVRTADGAATTRTIGVSGGGSIANGDGVAGAPAITIHAQSHAITSTSDHTSTATAAYMLKADASGLPVTATNTDAEVASAVSLKHTQGTDAGTTGNTFAVDSDSVTGRMILDVALGATDKTITITNETLTTDNVIITLPATTGTVALIGAAPTAHAASHITGGGDIIAVASTSAVGLAPAATAPGAGFLSVLAIGNGETVRTDKALFDTTNPEALGVAAPGTQLIAARRDHVHTAPASLHTQNTDSGTTGNTFTVDSDSATGKMILDVALNAGEDHSMTITNAAMTADVVITLPATTGTVALTGHTHTLANITDDGTMAAVNDATSDGNTYGRKNGAWQAVSSGIAGAKGCVGIVIDGGGSAVTTGLKGFVSCPFAGAISRCTIVADQAGTCAIDIWKDTWANFPPTVADTLIGGGGTKPNLAGPAQSYEDTTLTAWTTDVSAGDVFAFKVDAAGTVTRLNIQVEITRS